MVAELSLAQPVADSGYSSAAEAQDALNQHSITLHGRCLECDVEGPCGSRYLAERALRNNRQLPRRAPGATRPELLNLAHASNAGFHWLGSGRAGSRD